MGIDDEIAIDPRMKFKLTLCPQNLHRIYRSTRDKSWWCYCRCVYWWCSRENRQYQGIITVGFVQNLTSIGARQFSLTSNLPHWREKGVGRWVKTVENSNGVKRVRERERESSWLQRPNQSSAICLSKRWLDNGLCALTFSHNLPAYLIVRESPDTRRHISFCPLYHIHLTNPI